MLRPNLKALSVGGFEQDPEGFNSYYSWYEDREAIEAAIQGASDRADNIPFHVDYFTARGHQGMRLSIGGGVVIAVYELEEA